MSRIGRKPVPIPQGVKVEVTDGTVRAEGPKGKLTQPIPAPLSAKIEGNVLLIARPDDDRHVRALHGSATNTSDRPRNLLLYEVAASDAWPLMGVKDFDEFNSRLLSGDPVLAPRMTNVPVRIPLPPAKRQGSIYETQSAAKKSYFTRAA